MNGSGSRACRDAPPAGDRVRGGALVVLAAWVVFVVAGSSFAKISEHFDSSLSARTRTVPDLAYTAVQDIATLSGLTVVPGIALAIPALLRFVSRGGWAQVRRHVLRAAAATAPTAASTSRSSPWAHQLKAAQRNGGNAGYSRSLPRLGGPAVVTVALWTVAAVGTARRLTLSRPVLLVEGALAVTVTTGMLLMLAAAGVWWAAMASPRRRSSPAVRPAPPHRRTPNSSPPRPHAHRPRGESTGAVRIIRAARSLYAQRVGPVPT